MKISKTRDEFTMSVEVKVSFFDKDFAKAIGYEKEQTLFLSRHANADLFKLDNESEKLNTDDFRVFFEKDASDTIKLTFYRYAKKLHSDLSVELVESLLFSQSIACEVLSSDYDVNNTERVMWEFAATMALVVIDILSGGES